MASGSRIIDDHVDATITAHRTQLHSKFTTIASVIFYMFTGILQPILIDTLKTQGLLGRSWLLIPTLANTTGMAMCGLLTHSTQRREFQQYIMATLSSLVEREQIRSMHKKNGSRNGGSSSNNDGSFVVRMILLTAFVDLISGMCLTFGLLTTGGAIFVILYNSCPIWTTFLSWILLRHFAISRISLAGILLVTFGVIINVIESQLLQNGKVKRDEEVLPSSSSSKILTGSIIILVGSLLHSLMFVLSDLTLRPSCVTLKESIIAFFSPLTGKSISKEQGDNTRMVTPSGFMWSFCLGTIEASVMLLWVIMGILLFGFRDETNRLETEDNNQSIDIARFVSGFVLLVIVNAIHAATFFSILQNVGAVGSALLKGLQVIVVVVLTSIFFCSPMNESQCLTNVKASSVVFVSFGVFFYGIGNSKNGHHRSRPKENSHSPKPIVDPAMDTDHFVRKSDTEHTELRTLL